MQAQALRAKFPDVGLTPVVADFTKPLELPPLDGIVMANSLHFERDKLAVLALVRGYLRPAGRLVLVEYDADHGNQWVPYPLSFRTWATLATEAGFRDSRRLTSVPSPIPRVDLLGAQHPLSIRVYYGAFRLLPGRGSNGPLVPVSLVR